MGLEIWREITTEYNGRAIKCSFKFLDGVVTVRTLRGSKAAQVRGQTPEQLAKTLLRDWRATEWLKIRAQLICDQLVLGITNIRPSLYVYYSSITRGRFAPKSVFSTR
jgi:hypothetical protein